MRIWGWKKTSRNKWVFGNGGIRASIESKGREDHMVYVQDDLFGGTFDCKSGPHKKWIDAYQDVTSKMKTISRKIKSKIGGCG